MYIGHSPRTRKKISLAAQGRKASEETREKLSLAHLEMWSDLSYQIKMSEARVGNQNALGHIDSKETRMKKSLAMIGNRNGIRNHNALYHKVSEEAREKMSLSAQGREASEETKYKMSLAKIGNINAIRNHSRIGSTMSEESKNKTGLANLGNQYGLGHIHSGETRRKIRESWTPERRKWWSNHMKELWSDPNWKDSTIRASGLGSNNVMTRPEERLLNIIEDWEFKWKYNGNGSIIIGGCRPDFVPTNGFKGVIEHFGDYWHIDECELDKVKVYSQEGYSCLVFWEHELYELSDEIIAYLIIDFYTKGRNNQ